MRYVLILVLFSTFAYAKVFLYSNYPLRNNNFQKKLTEENMFIILWALQKLKDIKDIKVSTVGPDTVIYVERYPILKKVDIEGNRFASDEEIKNLILLREGEPLVDFDPEIASSTLRLFYSRMGFLDAQTHIDLKVDDKGYAYMKVKVKEGELYLLGGAEFEGLKRFAPERLLQEAELRIGDIFNEETARSAVDRIYRLYRKEGFLESSVYFAGIDKKKMNSPFFRALFPGIEGAKRSTKGFLITLFKGFSNLLSHPLAISKALLGKGSLAYPKYRINEGRKYSISFRGNRSFDRKTLLSLLDLDTPGVDIFFLEKSREVIEGFYRDKGFFDVLVRYSYEGGSVTFVIEEGERYRLRALGFKGLKLPPYYDREEIDKRVKEFLKSKRKEGYLTARMEVYKEIDRRNKVVYLVLEFFLGKKVILKDVVYVGKDEDFRELFGKYRALLPDRFDGKLIDSLNKDIKKLLWERGYLDGDFSVHIDVSEDEENMYLTYFYSIRKGDRYRYGELLIYGNEKTHPREIDYTVVKEEYFSSQAEEESLWNLVQSENYTGVRIENLIDRESKKVHRLVEVREDKRGVLELALGYNTEEKFKAEVGIKLKNLFGVGIISRLRASKSQKYETYEAGLSDKFLFSRKYFADISLFKRLEFHNSFDLQSEGGSASFGYRFSRWLSLSLSFSSTRNDVEGAGAGSFSLKRYGAFLLREVRDDPVNPKNITHLSLRFTRSEGDRNYYKVEANAFILREIVRGVSVDWKLSAGWVGAQAPVFDRFFLGGLRDMRGYDYESIGYPVGGRTYAFGRVELLFMIKEPLWVGFYSDAGGVGEKFSDTFRDLKYDLGGALGVSTPAGFIRLDLAKPISKLAQPVSKFKVYLSVGFVY